MPIHGVCLGLLRVALVWGRAAHSLGGQLSARAFISGENFRAV